MTLQIIGAMTSMLSKEDWGVPEQIDYCALLVSILLQDSPVEHSIMLEGKLLVKLLLAAAFQEQYMSDAAFNISLFTDLISMMIAVLNNIDATFQAQDAQAAAISEEEDLNYIDIGSIMDIYILEDEEVPLIPSIDYSTDDDRSISLISAPSPTPAQSIVQKIVPDPIAEEPEAEAETDSLLLVKPVPEKDLYLTPLPPQSKAAKYCLKVKECIVEIKRKIKSFILKRRTG